MGGIHSKCIRTAEYEIVFQVNYILNSCLEIHSKMSIVMVSLFHSAEYLLKLLEYSWNLISSTHKLHNSSLPRTIFFFTKRMNFFLFNYYKTTRTLFNLIKWKIYTFKQTYPESKNLNKISIADRRSSFSSLRLSDMDNLFNLLVFY